MCIFLCQGSWYNACFIVHQQQRVYEPTFRPASYGVQGCGSRSTGGKARSVVLVFLTDYQQYRADWLRSETRRTLNLSRGSLSFWKHFDVNMGLCIERKRAHCGFWRTGAEFSFTSEAGSCSQFWPSLMFVPSAACWFFSQTRLSVIFFYYKEITALKASISCACYARSLLMLDGCVISIVGSATCISLRRCESSVRPRCWS